MSIFLTRLLRTSTCCISTSSWRSRARLQIPIGNVNIKSGRGRKEWWKKQAERQLKWIFWMCSYSTKHTRNPLLNFSVHSSPTHLPPPHSPQQYAYHNGAATGFQCNSQAVKHFPFSIPSSPTSISTISFLFKHFFVYLYTELYLRLSLRFLLSKNDIQLNLFRIC
jgi:hypothetical protein